MKSIIEQIFSIAQLYPDKIAIIEGKNYITYSCLTDNIKKAKFCYFEKFGLKRGDRIIISANKQVGFVYTYLAAHLAGIIVIPIDHETNTTRFNFIIEKTRPSLIIGFNSTTTTIPCTPFDSFDDSNFHQDQDIQFPFENDIADIVFTTGTTGLPKGVILSHKNIAASTNNINTFIKNTHHEIELLALPISHSFGLGRMRCTLSMGATLILLGSFANVKRLFKIIDEYKVSGIAMVPASWSYLKKMSGKRIGEYAHLIKYIEIGSAPMTLVDKQMLMSLFPNTRICMHYGLTEASRSTFIEFHDDSNLLITIGKSSPNVDITIKNEIGMNLPFGEEGEICIKGDSVTTGYWEDPTVTKQSFWKEYFRTGDWGNMDEYGYVLLKSRKKELINVGGKKVSPLEVESVLLEIKGIIDCACIGIDDPNQVMGEVVKAYLVGEKGFFISYEEMRKLIENKLETYKIPVEIEWITEIPKTISGKIQRLLLKK